MFGNDEDKSSYEGLFAKKPDEVRHDWNTGGTVEKNRSVFESDTTVRKDFFGNVTEVKKGFLE